MSLSNYLQEIWAANGGSEMNHVPRYSRDYTLSTTVTTWAIKNVAEELLEPTVKYIAAVGSTNTWNREMACKFLTEAVDKIREQDGVRGEMPILHERPGKSLTELRSLPLTPNGESPFISFPLASASNQNYVIALDDCIHTGSRTIERLMSWWSYREKMVRDIRSPGTNRIVRRPTSLGNQARSGSLPPFVVRIVALSAHEEGLNRIRRWVKQRGGEYRQILGKEIGLNQVRERQRYPWIVPPGTEFAKLALGYPAIAQYLDAEQTGHDLWLNSATPEEQLLATPHPDDAAGACGLLLLSVLAFRKALANPNFTKRGGIRPMGYVDPVDQSERPHNVRNDHQLGFGSPFTSWINVPNTAPLGLWMLLNKPSLFTRDSSQPENDQKVSR